jgi:4,5-dihydroxyphthalate decarboxylase
MADLKMTLACWNYDRTRALMDGSVKSEGIELTYHNSFPAATFHRMMGKREFEASELGLTFYLDSLHEDDPPFVAIPAYPIRLFSHSAIYINTNKGIREPKDLIGKRIGEFFLYGHDAGTWSKGILQDHYGVPIDSYSNFIGGVERPTPPLPWYTQKPPLHIKVQHIGTETTLDAMLEAGEIDALFSALVPPSMARGSKNISRLFPDFEAVERNY